MRAYLADTVFDGREVHNNKAILVDGEEIVDLVDEGEIPREVQVISGKFLMPGIIDTHLHFSGNLTDDDSDWVLEPLLQKAVVATEQARECLENGLTSVGEIGFMGPHIRNMVERGIMKGPRVVTTGRGFCRTAGHGDSHNLPLDFVNESHPWAERVDGPWELRRAVRRRLRDNPDAIKIWSTGGGIWNLDRKLDTHYTMEEIQAVVDEANMVGLPVWSHAEGYEGAYFSAKAGVHLIIHGQTLNREALELMAQNGTYFCPTIQFLEAWFTSYEPPYDPLIHDLYEGETVAEKELSRVYANLRQAVEMGIGLTIGSDSFCSSLTPYGTTAIGEIIAFVEKAKLTPNYALTSATSIGAEMLKIDDVTGTLEAGKKADFIVLSKNPLDDIRNLDRKNMSWIVKEGEIIVSPHVE